MITFTKGDGTGSLILGDGKDGCCMGDGNGVLTLGGDCCDGSCSC